MAYYSYKMTYDYGFAPNPFGGTCTLATCKPNIRKKAAVGDWILGTGSKEINLLHNVIYLMQVTEKLLFEDYWLDKRFQLKKPKLNGSLSKIHGDNVYSKNEEGHWQQAYCQHSHPRKSMRRKHIIKDTGGKYVLLSTHFYYFGDACFKIDDRFKLICSEIRDHRVFKKSSDIACFQEFVDWVSNKYEVGVHGSPVDWSQYNQRELIFD